MNIIFHHQALDTASAQADFMGAITTFGQTFGLDLIIECFYVERFVT